MNLSAGFTIMRQRYGTNSLEMAKRTGKSIRSIQNIMAKNANPTFSSIQFICDAIGCSVEELIHEASKCPEEK